MVESEQGTFIFAITFILVFSGLMVSMPVAFYGLGGTATNLLPVNPNLLSDFAESENYTKSDFAPYTYSYDLGGYSWIAGTDGSTYVTVSQKIIIGILWFGAVENCEFVLSNGTSRGVQLSFAEIAGDAEDGAVRYDLRYIGSGNDAGGFVAYWNTTLYANPATAWANDKLTLLHGMGIDLTASTNVVTLLIGLLFFQIPEIPVLINLIIVAPIWTCIVYLLWYLIKESLPFW